jgi:hypothetical protein
MYIVDDIAYAGEKEPLLKVVGIRPMDDYMLWLRFSNNEERLYDVKPLLEYPVFKRLCHREVFTSVYLDFGVPTWLDGEIDIAPESLFENSITCQKTA